jgi:predicted flavoprotein YhiN
MNAEEWLKKTKPNSVLVKIIDHLQQPKHKISCIGETTVNITIYNSPTFFFTKVLFLQQLPERATNMQILKWTI